MVAPPTVTVNATDPGTTPTVLNDTVVLPIERELSGGKRGNAAGDWNGRFGRNVECHDSSHLSVPVFFVVVMQMTNRSIANSNDVPTEGQKQ